MAFQASKSGTSRVLFAWLLASLAITLAPTSSADAVMLSNDGSQATRWADEDAGRFEGVGRIECPDNHRQSILHVATGWVLGAADTVATAAHLFFKQGATNAAAGEVIDPTRCVFVLYDRNQQVREIAHIRYAVSPWTDNQVRQDSSYDVAVLKLDRPLKVASVPAVRAPKVMARPAIELVSLLTGLDESNRARITTGHVATFPASQLRNDPGETRITDASRLFSTSVDSTPGSSGGMYYDEQQQAAVGIHIGSICEQDRPSYDPETCFNYGLRFDSKIIALVGSVVRDQPNSAQLVQPGSDLERAVHLAMADQPNG